MNLFRFAKFNSQVIAASGLAHLDEKHLTPADANCRLCGNREREYVSRLQSKPDVDLLACPRCYVLSASRMPHEELLKAFYKNYYRYPDLKIPDHNSLRLAKHIYSLVHHSFMGLNEIEILDFGGGHGELSHQLAHLFIKTGMKKANITVLDYHLSETNHFTEEIVCERVERLDDLQGFRFHLVLASAVLEHLPSPLTSFRQMLNLMETGSVLYARTPFMEGFIRFLRKMRLSFDFAFPAHLHDMGSEFWNGLFKTVLPDLEDSFVIFRSFPSPVETSLREDFLRTVAASLFKLAYRVLGDRYTLVGGWEVFLRKIKEPQSREAHSGGVLVR